MLDKNPYKVLGARSDSSDEELKKLLRDYRIQWHPDKHRGSEEAKLRFQEGEEAYDILTTSDLSFNIADLQKLQQKRKWQAVQRDIEARERMEQQRQQSATQSRSTGGRGSFEVFEGGEHVRYTDFNDTFSQGFQRGYQNPEKTFEDVFGNIFGKEKAFWEKEAPGKMDSYAEAFAKTFKENYKNKGDEKIFKKREGESFKNYSDRKYEEFVRKKQQEEKSKEENRFDDFLRDFERKMGEANNFQKKNTRKAKPQEEPIPEDVKTMFYTGDYWQFNQAIHEENFTEIERMLKFAQKQGGNEFQQKLLVQSLQWTQSLVAIDRLLGMTRHLPHFVKVQEDMLAHNNFIVFKREFEKGDEYMSKYVYKLIEQSGKPFVKRFLLADDYHTGSVQLHCDRVKGFKEGMMDSWRCLEFWSEILLQNKEIIADNREIFNRTARIINIDHLDNLQDLHDWLEEREKSKKRYSWEDETDYQYNRFHKDSIKYEADKLKNAFERCAPLSMRDIVYDCQLRGGNAMVADLLKANDCYSKSISFLNDRLDDPDGRRAWHCLNTWVDILWENKNLILENREIFDKTADILDVDEFSSLGKLNRWLEKHGASKKERKFASFSQQMNDFFKKNPQGNRSR